MVSAEVPGRHEDVTPESIVYKMAEYDIHIPGLAIPNHA